VALRKSIKPKPPVSRAARAQLSGTITGVKRRPYLVLSWEDLIRTRQWGSQITALELAPKFQISAP
jgi:hypothetical protein